MKGRLNSQINHLLLLRLVELVRNSKKTLDSNLSYRAKVHIVQSELSDTFKLLGGDITSYIEKNIFCISQVRDAKFAKQFVHFKNEVNGPTFHICLN